jgi:hypothetical protein
MDAIRGAFLHRWTGGRAGQTDQTNRRTRGDAAQARNGVYRDLFYGLNLQAVPVTPQEESWWYRANFTIDGARQARERGRRLPSAHK